MPEPIYDLAHLGHLELLTPKPAESEKFFVDVMGMTVSGRKGESVYLRGWDDYERYSLKLTASKTSGMEHMALRARSPQALERRVAALKGSGFDIGWTDGDMGQGPAFRCRDPDGHIVELYYETEWYQPPPELKPALKNQAQRFPARGVNVRRLDHLNCLAVDIQGEPAVLRKLSGPAHHRADRAQRRLGSRDVDDDVEQELRLRLHPRSLRQKGPLPPRHLRARQPRGDSCAPPTSFWRTASTSRPARTSTRSSRPSSSMSRSPAATASKSPTPARGLSWRRTGSRSSGPRKSARRARRGG